MYLVVDSVQQNFYPIIGKIIIHRGESLLLFFEVWTTIGEGETFFIRGDINL